MAEQEISLIDYHYEDQGKSAGAALSMQITESGEIKFSGADFGPTTESMLGDWDYEYWLTIGQSERDKLLSALLKAQFTNPGSDEKVSRFTGISAFKEWLDEQGIKYHFQSY